jgi:hypothetical protein
MAYYCRVERDSVAPDGIRLTSFVITFPRVVLAETVTHRLNYDTWGEFDVSWCERTTDRSISKNSASSRAIPFEKMVEKVQADPYMPFWTLNQKGMQGQAAEDQVTIYRANKVWLSFRNSAIHHARELADLGIHKQDANRCLEPWAWITQIVTSSAWDNFFALRCHSAAHPAFRHVARMMFLTRRNSVPEKLREGQWHLPFVPFQEQQSFHWCPTGRGVEMPDIIKFSAARCGWVSYENHDRDSTPEAMLRTFSRFVPGDGPAHGSPCEHQATPLPLHLKDGSGSYLSNLRGWLQARKLLPSEACHNYNPSEEEVASWGNVLGE